MRDKTGISNQKMMIGKRVNLDDCLSPPHVMCMVFEYNQAYHFQWIVWWWISP
ncbi:MAG: hypothetical protein GF353_06505 [Candidatus Lokiarchaeota archaeon]|nr:hypothetical protein [Candidatus Lokiarchaeota archaeon]